MPLDPPGSETLDLTVQPFPVDVLPDALARFVSLSADSIDCDPSFVVGPLLPSLAAAIGNSRRVRVKPGWSEPCILWVATLGVTGDGKSPGLDQAVQFAHGADELSRQAFDLRAKEHGVSQREYERDFSRWKRGEAAAAPPDEPTAPLEERCIISDITIEKVAQILQSSPRGVLLARDELSGWISGFGQYKNGAGGSDEAQWLELYGGRRLVIDRKGSGSLVVPRASVSIAGGIQPGVLKRLLTPNRFENGLVSRFQFLMPRRRVRRWRDSSVNPELQATTAGVFSSLYDLQPSRHEGTWSPIELPFSPEAQRRYISFYNTQSDEQVQMGVHLAAAWEKLRAFPARLALIVHCVRQVSATSPHFNPRVIDEESLDIALQVTRWFKHETRRVYAFFEEGERAGLIRALIEAAELANGRLSIRDAQRRLGRQISSAREAKELLGEIVAGGRATWEEHPHNKTTGRPSSPAIVLFDVDRTDRTRTTGMRDAQAESSVSSVSDAKGSS
ncbi:MAG: DUF3987 domain-containing protein [Myxococcales bacterium]|nr:DUF3987 domain-containing protein [Myxococcales bacterium]